MCEPLKAAVVGGLQRFDQHIGDSLTHLGTSMPLVNVAATILAKPI
jgi:hypothetical protein